MPDQKPKRVATHPLRTIKRKQALDRAAVAAVSPQSVIERALARGHTHTSKEFRTRKGSS